MEDVEKLKARIDSLLLVYGALFGVSLVALVANWSMGRTALGTAIWVLTLAGAVATRLYRTSLVNRYNAALLGDDAPLR